MRELHETPQYVIDALARAGGKNPFGEPNFRVVWGWNRLTPIGGKWTDRDASGNVVREVDEMRYEPAYEIMPNGNNRWHVEAWLPAEIYGSPFEWESHKDAGIVELGPYPSRGEYEHVWTLEGLHGEFLQLTPTLVNALVRRIQRTREALHKKTITMAQKRTREKLKEDDYEKWAFDMMDDNATWSYTPHAYLPAHLKEKIA